MRVRTAHAAPPERGVGTERPIPPQDNQCLLFLEVTLPRRVPPAEQTWSHSEEGGIWRQVFLDMAFHSPDALGLGLATAQCLALTAVPVESLVSYRP